MAKKFTFKTEQPTGRYRSFEDPTYHIKYNKIKVGYFDPNKPFRVHLQVVKDDIKEDGNEHCVWKWIKIGHYCDTLEEAKKRLNENCEAILKRYTLHLDKE